MQVIFQIFACVLEFLSDLLPCQNVFLHLLYDFIDYFHKHWCASISWMKEIRNVFALWISHLQHQEGCELMLSFKPVFYRPERCVSYKTIIVYRLRPKDTYLMALVWTRPIKKVYDHIAIRHRWEVYVLKTKRNTFRLWIQARFNCFSTHKVYN